MSELISNNFQEDYHYGATEEKWRAIIDIY
jgi:hypothetical protein